MNRILNLPPETEARLRQAAEESEKALSWEFSSEPELSRDEWLKQFNEWMSQVNSRNPNDDDSRGSIYE